MGEVFPESTQPQNYFLSYTSWIDTAKGLTPEVFLVLSFRVSHPPCAPALLCT